MFYALNVVGDERGVSFVCDAYCACCVCSACGMCGVWLCHGKQPVSKTDGGSSRNVMFRVREDSCYWWWMKGGDNVVGEPSVVNWRFKWEFGIDVAFLFWRSVSTERCISGMTLSGDSIDIERVDGSSWPVLGDAAEVARRMFDIQGSRREDVST